MSDDKRPLVTVLASRIGEVWALRSETAGKVENGFYLMIPTDGIEQSAQICIDIGRGMAARKAVGP